MYKCVISIVTWNSEQYLKKCVEACLAQQLEGVAIVIVDNDSKDGTRAIIREYGDRVLSILSDTNTGFSGGHNLAIKNFKAEYYCVLNPDVFLDSDYLKHSTRFLDEHPQYGGVIGKVLRCSYKDGNFEKTDIIDTCGLGVKRSYHFYAVGNGEQDQGQHNERKDIFGVDGMCPVYSGKMLESIVLNGEYFDEFFFAYCEDQDLSWRAKNSGWKFSYLPEALAYHIRTWKPASLSARKQINKDTRKMALRNHYLMLVRNLTTRDFFLGIPFIGWRMIKVVGYCLLFERYSLRAYSEAMGNFKRYYKTRKKR